MECMLYIASHGRVCHFYSMDGAARSPTKPSRETAEVSKSIVLRQMQNPQRPAPRFNTLGCLVMTIAREAGGPRPHKTKSIKWDW